MFSEMPLMDLKYNHQTMFGMAIQSYYTASIPLYSNTYKYLDLIKLILFMNNITMYSNTNGVIILKRRDFNYSGATTKLYLNRSEILKPFSVNSIERNNDEIDVLNNIYYSEDGYVGPNGEFLDAYMKQKYQTIFNKIPTEVSFPIRAETESGALRTIEPDSLIIISNNTPELPRYVAVTQYLFDKDNFIIDIKGYLYNGSISD